MTMPGRLTIVSDLERQDHYYLPAEAKCYFWGEYTPFQQTDGKGWNFSPTNQLISNFKKKMDKAGLPEWRYKREAIATVAKQFSKFWKWSEIQATYRIAVVPVPPSKREADPLFDNRMFQMLCLMSSYAGVQLDIRDCLRFSGVYGATHESEIRPSPTQLYEDLSFDVTKGHPDRQPGMIFLFDDLLTTGAHYVAAVQKLKDVFPGIEVVGNFIARRRI